MVTSSNSDNIDRTDTSTERSMNWKALAGTAASRAKEYVANREYKNTYDKVSDRIARMRHSRETLGNGSDSWKTSGIRWAQDRISRVRQNSSDKLTLVKVERLHLFPGWAVRRYRSGSDQGKECVPFDIEIFVSGYASSLRPPEFATRAQKMFMQLARRYAALPRLPDPERAHEVNSRGPIHSSFSTISPPESTEDILLNHPLPPTPLEMTEEREAALLDAQFRKAEEDEEEDRVSNSASDSPPASPVAGCESPSLLVSSTTLNIPINQLQKLHANLDTRLEPFWSSSLGNRTISLSVFATDPVALSRKGASSRQEELLIDLEDEEDQPLVTGRLTTTPQGDFQQRLVIPWERLCTHPRSLQIAFGSIDHSSEYHVYVQAQMWASPTQNGLTPQNRLLIESIARVKLTSTRLRVISDIDDTVKHSDILSGAKVIFHNVFVRELQDLVIHNMSEWYNRMSIRGVRFHYVSNAPFQLLPILKQFIQISDLPDGSVKLRSYGGRSIFDGLLSGSAVRKRNNVLEVLDAFPESKFMLIGDSGEQDLELYVVLAKERPEQVLSIFIRDVSTRGEPITDPTGSRWQSGKTDDVLDIFPNPHATPQRLSYYDPNIVSGSHTRLPVVGAGSDPYSAFARSPMRVDSHVSQSPSPHSPSSTSDTSPSLTAQDVSMRLEALSYPTRQRVELQMRVNRARDEIPSSVVLRVFRDPSECTESEEIVTNVGL